MGGNGVSQMTQGITPNPEEMAELAEPEQEISAARTPYHPRVFFIASPPSPSPPATRRSCVRCGASPARFESRPLDSRCLFTEPSDFMRPKPEIIDPRIIGSESTHPGRWRLETTAAPFS